MQNTLSLPPLSLYIHIPWCVRKCPYCDFNSHARVGDTIAEQAYIEALLADFDQELPRVQGREIHSLFIGGGTPSLVSAQGYQRLLSGLQARVPFARNIEITLEANPGACEYDRFQGYLEAGINRISLGVQSFQTDKLKALGRIHSAREALDAIDRLRQSGVVNLNIDLMHGLPGQSTADALYDLQTAIAQQPAHISWYQLTIEPNTVFYSRTPTLPEDEQLWAIQAAGQELLAQAGYQQYEISAYSRPEYRACHNLNYWRFGDYLGIGAGAHGKWTCADSGTVHRNWKTRMPDAYMAPEKPFQAGQRTLDAQDCTLEFMMNALRLCEGVETSLYSQRTGQSLALIQPRLEQAVRRGLMVAGERLAPSRQGQLFLNDLLELFV